MHPGRAARGPGKGKGMMFDLFVAFVFFVLFPLAIFVEFCARVWRGTAKHWLATRQGSMRRP